MINAISLGMPAMWCRAQGIKRRKKGASAGVWGGRRSIELTGVSSLRAVRSAINLSASKSGDKAELRPSANALWTT